MQDVADDGAGGRGDDADDLGQVGQRLLALLGEQALGGEAAAALLQELEERALAGELDRIDDDLVARARRIGGQAARAHHLHAVLGPDGEGPRDAAPAHGVEDRLLVLEGEVEVARVGPAQARDLAAHAHALEGALERAPHRDRDLAHGVLGDVVGERRAVD